MIRRDLRFFCGGAWEDKLISCDGTFFSFSVVFGWLFFLWLAGHPCVLFLAEQVSHWLAVV
jgi:hypothetical protein